MLNPFVRSDLTVVCLFLLATFCPLATAAVLPEITDLQLHFDASDTSTVLDFQSDLPGDVDFTGNVQKWNDLSGNSYVADAGGSHAATYATDGLNGSTPALRFTGNDSRRMSIANFSHGGDETIFAVFNPAITTSGQMFNTGGAAAAGGGTYVLDFTGGEVRGRVYTGTDWGQVSAPVTVGESYIASYVVKANTTEGAALALNGAIQGTASTNAVNTVSTSATLGNHPTGSTVYKGDLAELLVFGRALGVGEQKQIGLYLEEKYALPTSYNTWGNGDEISINFSRSIDSPTWTVLGSTEMAGVVQVPNWNNVNIDQSATFASTSLVDANGLASTVTITSTVSPGYDGSNNGTGNSTPNHAMMNGSLYFDNVNGTDTGNITLDGLLDTFTPDKYIAYDVYLYFESNDDDRDMTFTIDGTSLTGLDDKSFNGTFIEATGSGITADYVLFQGLTSNLLTIDAAATNGRAAIAGIQIVGVPVPEPSSFVLATIGLSGLVILFRRKRSK